MDQELWIFSLMDWELFVTSIKVNEGLPSRESFNDNFGFVGRDKRTDGELTEE